MARLLIVDDEESIRELIKEVLSGQGHEFELAADGAAALEALARSEFDLAIVDRKMPGMDGLALVAAIRGAPKTQSLKVLMCTGASAGADQDRARAAGADGCIEKPLRFSALLRQVAQALATPRGS